MGKSIGKRAGLHEVASVSLGELIHQHVRIAIETAVHEELRAALGARSYERSDERRGYRNGTKARALTGPSGPVVLTVPRARLFGATEWTSTILPRYQRRLHSVNKAIVATYLAGGNTRRIRGALRPLLKDATLSKSAVSRVVATLKTELAAWRTRSLADVDAVYLYLDAFALRVRSAGKVVSVPVLGVVGVRSDGGKHLLALSCAVVSLRQRGKGASTIWWPVACARRCSASSTEIPGCAVPLARSGRGRRCNVAVCTSSATSSAKHRNMRWPRSATTSIASSTRVMPTLPAPPTRPLSESGPSAAQAL